VLSPATLAALQRLVAILLALTDALAAHVDASPRPLVARLAVRAFSAYLKHLAAHLTQTANDTVADPGAQATPDPTPTPHPTRARRIRVRHTPPAPRIFRFPSPPTPETKPLHIKFGRLASRCQHV
jgi:hypothetical protein